MPTERLIFHPCMCSYLRKTPLQATIQLHTQLGTGVSQPLLIHRSLIKFLRPPLAALPSLPPGVPAFPCTLLLLAPVIPLIPDTHSFPAISPSRLWLLCHAVMLTYKQIDINMRKSRGRPVM